MKQTCILVLGMHRSGTSALTGVLQYLDIDLGSKLLGPLKENEKGFFENAYLMRFDDKLLRKINSSWDDIFFDYDEKEQLIDQSDKEELKNILKQEFGNSSLFAIKDPRICYLFPLYEKALNELDIDMKIVLPYRNPLEVAESLEKRNGFSVEKSVALWLNYFLYAEFYSRKYERFFLKFDELINHTEKSIKALSEALQIDIFERYNRHKNDVNNFLEADLKHNNIYGFNLPKGLRVTLKEIAVLYDENLNDVKQEKFDALKYSNDEYRTFYSNISKVNEELKILKDESHDLKEKNQILQEANYRLEQIDLALKNELSQIKNSRAWKFAILLRKIKQNIFGETKLLYSFIDMAKVLNISNFKKLLHHLKEGNFSLIKEKLFYTIDATSNKSLKLDIVTTKNYKNIFIPFSKNPIVTIVVPVYNQWHYTYNCIGAIVRNSGLVPYEIIVADDVSTDETVNIDKYIKNIKHIRNEKNLGFLLNCNNAAKYVNGKYILFLNNDTQVQPHWLSSLVELIESDDKIGMVGSKLVYPDGRLQEAGGIVWNDASGWNYGKFDDPTKSEYNYVKEVDYISGASIMIKKTLWNEIGGFDERYVPAYYEDADLAFEVRKHCYKVMFQPKSVVVHFEGISNGTDVQSGIKKHQVENKEKFFNKWKATLKQHFKNGTNVFIARDRSMAKPHILFIDHYIPHYDQDAGSKATFQYLQMFVDSGMNVHFIGDNFYQYPDKPYFDTLTQSKMEVLHGVWYLKNWKKWLSENGRYFDYIILSRPHIAVKYIDFIKEVTNSRIIYFPVDLHYLREKRESEIKHSKKTLDDSGYMK
ncbi:MAG: hypothetical protein QG567_42 [Campylobacterota bacterium]|nr:hypothetical protein [Campylobacterota bacterium]